jgi:hypothetical protein
MVGSVQVRLDGEGVRRWLDVIPVLAPGEEQLPSRHTTVAAGTVVLPGESVALLELPDSERTRRFWQAVDERVEIRVCYCSLYRACWVAPSPKRTPSETGRCTPDPDGEFLF